MILFVCLCTHVYAYECMCVHVFTVFDNKGDIDLDAFAYLSSCAYFCCILTLNRLTFLVVLKLSYILLVAATDIFLCLLMLLKSGLQRTLGILIPV